MRRAKEGVARGDFASVQAWCKRAGVAAEMGLLCNVQHCAERGKSDGGAVSHPLGSTLNVERSRALQSAGRMFPQARDGGMATRLRA